MDVLPADYVVMLIYIVGIIALNVYISHQGKSWDNMAFGDWSRGAFGTAASMIVVEWGVLGLFYLQNAGNESLVRYMLSGWSLLFAFLVLGFTGLVTLWPRRHRCRTTAELLGQSFGNGIRGVYAALMCITCLLVAAVALRQFSMIFAVCFDANPRLMILLIVFLAMSNTIRGGWWTVGATDRLHFVILAVMIPLVVVYLVRAVGGWTSFVEQCAAAVEQTPLKASLSSMELAPGGLRLVLYACLPLCLPGVFGRSVSASSARASVTGYALGALALLPISVFWGILSVAPAIVRPEKTGAVALAETIFRAVPKGASGFVVVFLIASIMTLLSNILLSGSRMLTSDLIFPILERKHKLAERGKVKLMRRWVYLGGFACLLLGWLFTVNDFAVFLDALTSVLLLGGTVCVGAAMIGKGATKLGAWLSLILSGGVYMALLYVWHWSITWAVLLGFAGAVLGMLLGSLISCRRGKEKGAE